MAFLTQPVMSEILIRGSSVEKGLAIENINVPFQRLKWDTRKLQSCIRLSVDLLFSRIVLCHDSLHFFPAME